MKKSIIFVLIITILCGLSFYLGQLSQTPTVESIQRQLHDNTFDLETCKLERNNYQRMSQRPL